MVKNDSFRFSIQFNLKNEDHRKALERLNKIRKGDKSEFCINCILEKHDENQEIKKLIKQTIKECLKDIQISNIPKEQTSIKNEEEVEIMDGVLDFMTAFD